MIQRNWQELIKPQKLNIQPGRRPDREATIIVEPLERGFGITLAECGDRVLDGAAGDDPETPDAGDDLIYRGVAQIRQPRRCGFSLAAQVLRQPLGQNISQHSPDRCLWTSRTFSLDVGRQVLTGGQIDGDRVALAPVGRDLQHRRTG